MEAFRPEHKRTIYCGQVRPEHIGKEVVVCGWVHRRRDHGGLVFVDLRDREGLIQVVINPEMSAEAHEKADALRVEYVVSVRGTVRQRPEGTENPNLPTGQVEVAASSLAILNESKPIPFSLEDDTEIYYMASAYFAPGEARGLRYDDPALAITWPHPVSMISEQDRNWPSLVRSALGGQA